MTSLAAKYISQKVLGESVSNKFGSEDLYFETVPASRLDGVPSKKKTQKRRKAIPAGISDKDAKILTKVKRRAYRLDMSLFNCCGIRFGWSSVIGLVPAIGDFIDLFMALMGAKILKAKGEGLPAVDVTDPDEFDLYDQQLSSDDEPPRYTSRVNTETVSPREPGGRNRNSWFGYGGSAERTKQPDPEQGRRDRSERTKPSEPEPSLPARPKKAKKSGRR
ncbi:hypothetical protein DID88_001498 [Monilinia fructigena]|uniref:Uncharacterized protein n=1 Tax=Monilinia fructigena TaxID=38457 RepID=A0A395IYF4_9HELO|nr:hypothetical protein DID88_001498 [Monilinia fructigena]